MILFAVSRVGPPYNSHNLQDMSYPFIANIYPIQTISSLDGNAALCLLIIGFSTEPYLCLDASQHSASVTKHGGLTYPVFLFCQSYNVNICAAMI